jgi:hypothetical protein
MSAQFIVDPSDCGRNLPHRLRKIPHCRSPGADVSRCCRPLDGRRWEVIGYSVGPHSPE